jgi:hypothetical protein
MYFSVRLAALAAACVLFTAPLLGYAHEARTKTHHQHFASKSANCPLRRTPEGELVDCRGWRLRSNVQGWDNTCFNLDYLPSQFACSGTGGGW